MPRQFLRDRCKECRERRVRCDGKHPTCSSCQKRNRRCHWPSADRPSPAPESSVSRLESLVSTKDPKAALKDFDNFRLYQNYVFNLAAWYDLNDRQRHFTDVVPVRARDSPLLLSAILAFSAINLAHRKNGEEKMGSVAEFYHLESVEMLLEITRNGPMGYQSKSDTLAAICLLRSYEIISGTPLTHAAFWNYLREDITMALIERRKLMIELTDDHFAKTRKSDDEEANAVTVLLGQTINLCFDEKPLDVDRWMSLNRSLGDWEKSLPGSFEPITDMILPRAESRPDAFPLYGTLHGWHAAARQYYKTASMILLLATPPESSTATTAIGNMRQFANLTLALELSSSEICALALSSESEAVWVNSFGPIAFCGRWLRGQRKRDAVIKGVLYWGAQTGWPVTPVVQSLQGDS
ncbi:hypothetical protein N7532_009146 [Penicillium argentinense]|uniref:Zn(2)-C6 fungal-type domain-containing protein n=1 Tax=Penicillium argentinense TaxID=1131581 RepID=A0A9W9EYR5_9EURO|nr:uncharacterized protein N7532_009146 [Penicillium argentinense]KAJ5090462.1 hypothetical protein N7532_009146 [Penicillium argentinense]